MPESATGRRLADSIVIGAVALAWALACDALTGFSMEARQQLRPWLAVLWVPGVPVLAVLNLFFVIRDFARRKRVHALLGLALSLVAALEPLIIPVLAR